MIHTDEKSARIADAAKNKPCMRCSSLVTPGEFFGVLVLGKLPEDVDGFESVGFVLFCATCLKEWGFKFTPMNEVRA